MNNILKYFNNAQNQSMQIGANKETIIAARGSGKSEGIDAVRLLRNVQFMPGSTGGLISPTYTKLLQNTLPAVCAALERMGYFQDVHYVIGKRPLKGYARAKRMPRNFENIMYWYNGSYLQFISLDGKMSVNSMSFDYLLGFEAKFLKFSKLQSEVFPALRGGDNYFGDCAWHGGYTFTSDMPTQADGLWLLDNKKFMDVDVIDAIKYLYLKTQKAKKDFKQNATEHYRRVLKQTSDDLTLFRKNAYFYAEYNIFDNAEIVGLKRIEELSRELSPMMFQVSVLNKRLRRIERGFYPKFSEKMHTYEPPNSSHVLRMNWNFKQTSSNCLYDGDIDTGRPLCIACDYNAAINNIVTGQRVDNEARILRHSFAKSPQILSDAVQQWCDYYGPSSNRDVIYFFDHTAVARTAQNESYKDTVIKVLERNRWNVRAEYFGQAPRHDAKYEWISQGMSFNPEYLTPSFNKFNNEDLILAIQLTGVNMGKNGFEKDKSLEKLIDSPDNPDEIKTHSTDAFDTLYVGLNFHYPGDNLTVIPHAQSWQ